MEENQMQKDEIEIDLADIFRTLLRKAWIIILVTVLCGGIAGVYTKYCMTPMYQSTSTLLVLSNTTGITSVADLQVGTQLTNDYLVLIKSKPVVQTVIENLELEDVTYSELADRIELKNPENTRVIYITVSDKDPETAKEIADEFAEVANAQMTSIMKTNQSSIVERGTVAQYASSPSLKKNCVIAAMLGFLVSCIIIFIIHMLDDTIKTTEDIEKYLELNTLGSIPLMEKPQSAGKRKSVKRKRRKTQ